MIHRSCSIRRALRLIALPVLGLPLALAASPASAQSKQEDEAALYAIGVSLAQSMEAGLGITKEELAKLQSGMDDYFAGKAKPSPEDGPKVKAFQAARLTAAREREKLASAAFIEEQAQAKGARKLESGVVYTEVAPGTGESPTKSDRVRVTYKGTLRDGSVFDSNEDRNAPAEFSLGGVIPCWQEAIAKMKPGGKARFVCPAQLAYGDRGSPPLILPGAALQFGVELLEVVAK